MITRRSFLASSATQTLTTPKRPNVIVILTDQHRFDALAAHGNHIIRTPNLDRLAAQSANFSSAYVQSPVCVPSRVTLLTGRYPHSHKNRVNYTPCDPSEVFLQRMLHDAGYQTGTVGKLHYYPPTADHARSTGFERVQLDDGVQSTDPYSDYVKWRHQHDPQHAVPYLQTMDVPAGRNPFRGVIDYRFTPTAWTGEQGVQMLKDLAVSSRPFFLHVSFFKPHSPYTVPEPWDAMYDDFLIPLPKQVSLNQIKELPLPVQRQILRGRPQYEMDRQRLQWIYRSYYASVSMVDREIGLILDELDRSGKAEHTIVVFTTDHGDQLLEHGLEGKNLFFESSVHVPYMIRYPWHVKPARYNQLVETIDTVPTILEFCGLPVPTRIEGRSLAPLIAREAFPRKYAAREMVFSENIIPEVITNAALDFPFTPGVGIKDIRHPDCKMVRTRRWKFNYYPGNGGELYDLENDPDETRNVIASPENQKQVQELKGAILDWMITADEASQIAPRWRIP